MSSCYLFYDLRTHNTLGKWHTSCDSILKEVVWGIRSYPLNFQFSITNCTLNCAVEKTFTDGILCTQIVTKPI